MSVVAMSKIKLMGINTHKEKILNALYRTGCVELSESEEFTDTFRVPSDDSESASSFYVAIEKTIGFYYDILEKCKAEPFYPKNFTDDKNFFVSYDEFIRSYKKSEMCERETNKAKEYADVLLEIKADRVRLNNLNAGLEPYREVSGDLSSFKDTKNVKIFFGTVAKDYIPTLKARFAEAENAGFAVLGGEQTAVIMAFAHTEFAEAVTEALSECNFSACPYKFDCTAKEKIAENYAELKRLDEQEHKIYQSVCENVSVIRDLKILYDYYGFILEKEREQSGFACTGSTFILEGFVPSDKTEEVKSAVQMASDAVFMEFSKPREDENVPTLLKNGFAVRQTEFITDMYSTPNYKEKDPNRAVFFFFMLFMGVIMADIGYGVIMIALGLAIAGRIKVDNGTRRLWYNIAIGGFFAILFGVLFNSLFGVSVLPFTVLPSPVPPGGGQEPTGLMTILLCCLALGVLQIAFGYFMKALNLFKSGDVAGGIFDGLCWVLFFIGFVFASFNFLINYLMPEGFENMDKGIKNFFDTAATPGLIVMLSALLLASVTAGRSEKGFGKVSKSFGAVYGLINIFSDILSYARLFGLMLSGMIIAQTFNDIGTGLFATGIIGYVFGGAVILIGHTFNLAMGVLGAYIHDSRLQYIEFFGKFYTGEGNKFAPIGSDMKYVYVVK